VCVAVAPVVQHVWQLARRGAWTKQELCRLRQRRRRRRISHADLTFVLTVTYVLVPGESFASPLCAVLVGVILGCHSSKVFVFVATPSLNDAKPDP
jgi:hypothetical protein